MAHGPIVLLGLTHTTENINEETYNRISNLQTELREVQ